MFDCDVILVMVWCEQCMVSIEGIVFEGWGVGFVNLWYQFDLMLIKDCVGQFEFDWVFVLFDVVDVCL